MRPSRREHEDREREPSPRKSPFVNARTVFARLPVAFFFSCFFSPPRVSRTTRRAPQPLPPHRLTYRKSSTIAGLDLPRVQLLLSTTQAVLVAFARHPDRLASLLEEEDDAEAAYAFFDAAAQLAVSASERADRLGMTRERRTELARILRAIIAPSGRGSDWVARAEEALRAAVPPPPEMSSIEVFEPFAGDEAAVEDVAARAARADGLVTVSARLAPARSELSVYMRLTRESARATALAEPAEESALPDAGSADTARRAFLSAFDDVLRVDASCSAFATTGERRRSRVQATGDASVRPRTPAAASIAATAARPATTGTNDCLPPLPSIVERLARDVARYATESLRAHARLLDAETFRRRVAFDERRFDANDERSALSATTKASTIETLSILTAAALEAPPRVSVAARDAAAAAIRLGRAVAEFSDDAEDIEDTARGLRAYVTAALNAHPTALAEVRACLATTFLAAPFRALPLLSEDTTSSSRGSQDDSRHPAGTTMRYAVAAGPSGTLLNDSGTLRRAVAMAAASATASPPWLAAVNAGICLLDDADREGGTKPKMDPLPPKKGALDRVLSATLLAAVVATASNGGARRRARATATALIRRAESLARVAPLAARHVSAVVALVHIVRSGIEDTPKETERTLDAETADALASASSALRAAVLGDAAPCGPAIGDAALARASRNVRIGFARRVIATCPTSSPSVLALAGGWLVAEMRAGAARGGGGDDVASRACFSAALETIRNTGWATRARGRDKSDRLESGCFDGWYSESADATRSGFATRERLALCLLAFHGASKEARAEALAEAGATAVGKDTPDPSTPPRRPRDGALARAARAHAACLFAHCARHVDAPPSWLETRVRRVLRVTRSAEPFATALEAALDACLFEADPSVQEEHVDSSEVCFVEDALPATVSSLPHELVASVRAAALALADDEPASDASETTLAAVSANARRAAWDSLRALPDLDASETRTRETLMDATARASTSASEQASVGSFVFAWRCASCFRLPASTALTDASVAAMDAVVAALDAGDAMVSPLKMSLTCAAAEALSRRFAASVTRDDTRTLVPSWFALAELAAALAAATRRWTAATLTGRLSPSDARVATVLLSAGIRSDAAAPALDAARAGLACSVSEVLGNDGRWPARRRSALRGAVTPEEAARAYLDGSDVASALFACQMATVAALEATARSARADATLDARAAAAAAARVRINAIVADPATEFAGDAAREAFEALRDAGPGASPEVLAATCASATRVDTFSDATRVARRPCPAAAMAALRADDDPAAVDAVLRAAAACVSGRSESDAPDDAEASDADAREATLRAAAALLTRDDVSLSTSASLSLLDVMSTAASPELTVCILAAGSKADEPGGNDPAAAAAALARLMTRGSPSTRDAAATALRRMLRSAREDEASSPWWEDAEADAEEDAEEAERDAQRARDARDDLLRALLGQLPAVCLDSTARDATRYARLLFELALADETSAVAGASAVADAFAALVAAAAETHSAFDGAKGTPRENDAALASFCALLRALAGFLATPEAVALRTRRRREKRKSRALAPAFAPEALPPVPRAASPPRSPTRASETGASTSAFAVARTESGWRQTTAAPSSTAASARARLLSTSLIRDIGTALGSLGGFEGLEGLEGFEGLEGLEGLEGVEGLEGLGGLDALAGLGLGDPRDVRDDVEADRERELERDTARAAAIAVDASASASRPSRRVGATLRASGGGAYGIRLDDDDADDDHAFFFDEDDAGASETDFADIAATAAAAASDFVVSGRRFDDARHDAFEDLRGTSSVGRAGGDVSSYAPRGSTSLSRDLNVCTFVSSGSSFVEQHWYFCYTCDLTTSCGCCSTCAKTCHRGHKVVYARKSRFFCDCGSGNAHGVSCQCLTERSAAAAAVAAEVEAESRAAAVAELAASAATVRRADADSERRRVSGGPTPITVDSDSEDDEDDAYLLLDDSDADSDDYGGDIVDVVGDSKDKRDALREALRGAGLAPFLVATCERILERLRKSRPRVSDDETTSSTPRLAFPESGRASVAAADASGAPARLVHLRRSFKAGSFETRPSRREHDAASGNPELRLAIESGTITRSALSCSRGAGLLAVAEGDKVCVLDAGAIAGFVGPGAVGGSAMKDPASSLPDGDARVGVRPLSRNPVDFEVARVCFNPANDAYLAVAGFAEARVFVFDEAGEVVDRLRVGPETWPLDGARGAILDVAWVPCEPACVAIVVAAHVAVFDLSVSAAAPAAVARLASGDDIVAAAFARRKGALALLLLADTGEVYAKTLEGGVDAFDRNDDVVVTSASKLALPEEVTGRAGLDMHYSEAHGVAFAAFDGGASVAFKLDFSSAREAKTTCTCVLLEDLGRLGRELVPEDAISDDAEATRSVALSGFSRWGDACVSPPPPLAGAPVGPTTPPLPQFVAVSARSGGAAVLVSLAEDAFAAQSLAAESASISAPSSSAPDAAEAGGGASAVCPGPKQLGHCGFQPTDSDVAFLFALSEDGSLRVFACEPAPPPGVVAADAQRAQLARAADRAAGRAAAAAKMAGGVRSEDEDGRDGSGARSRADAEEEITFPLDFFERVECVTAETRFGGDLVRGRSSESTRLALASDSGGGGVEAPGAGAHDLVLTLTDPDRVIRGLRVHVGDGSVARVPKDLRVGPKPLAADDRLETSTVSAAGTRMPGGSVDARRRVAFETGARRWYDIPLTAAETLAAGRELVVTFGEATSPSTPARVDRVEVYAVSKTAFGWDREVASARATAERGVADRTDTDADADAESDAESDADPETSKTAARIERIVRHAEHHRRDVARDAEERALRAALAALAGAAAIEVSAEMKENAAALALRVLEPDVRGGSFEADCDAAGGDGGRRWTPSVATRRVAWCALLAASGDSAAAAAARKDAAVAASVSERVTRLADVPARRGPAPADALAFHRAARAAARCAFRRPRAFAASPVARAASATMVHIAEDMLEAGGGAWDAEEFAGHLATIAVAVAESPTAESPTDSANAASPSRGDDVEAVDAARLAKTLLLAGRDDARRAAADALTDALVAPAGAHPSRDYARALRPDGFDEPRARVEPGSLGSGSSRGGDAGLAGARFACDACGASPIVGRRWHCALCADYDVCDACHERADDPREARARIHPTHVATHPMVPFEGVGAREETRKPEALDVSGARKDDGFAPTRSAVAEPSPGKVALARALAVASADDDALGRTRGIRELIPFFVLLRRLAAVPAYAAAMAPAAFAGARASAAATAESASAAATAESASAPGRSETARSAAADEKTLLRLSFLSRVVGGARGETGRDPSLATSEAARADRSAPLLDSLRVLAETMRARALARGAAPPGAAEASVKGETRGRRDGRDDASASFDRDSADLERGRDADRTAREREETRVTRRARFGDPRFATSSEAFRDEPAAHAGVADAADVFGVRLGFGAALDPTPPFAPAGSRATREARLPVRAPRERDVGDANRVVDCERFESRLFETAAGLVARLAEADEGSVSAVSDVRLRFTLDAASRRAWLATLAGASTHPRRSRTRGSRRVARRALLALAGTERAYRAARDDAAFASLFERLARAALPPPGAWFEQRAPYAALLEASACLASASALAKARPESWRRFVAGKPEALQAVATLAAWAAEPARLRALALLARAAPRGDEEASTLGGGDRPRGVSAAGTIDAGRFHRDVRSGVEDAEAETTNRAAAEAVTSLVVGSDFGNFFRFFLGARSAEVSDATRAAACAVARATWRASPCGSFARREMARATFEALPGLAPLGARAREAFALARWFVESGFAESGSGFAATSPSGASAFGEDFSRVLSDESGIVDALAEELARRIETLETHPNAATYAALRALDPRPFGSAASDASGFEPFILETDPSPAAFAGPSNGSGSLDRRSRDDARAFATHRLETLRSDLWHTHCAIAARLRAPTTVRAVTLSARAAYSGASRATRVRRFSVYVAAASADAAALKAALPLAFGETGAFPEANAGGTLRCDRSNDDAETRSPDSTTPVFWKRVAVGEMDPDSTEAEIEFPTPVAARAVAIRLDAFHARPDARARETLRCPRCARHVADRHGVCSHCRENAHQCRRCRNINYERPDAFLCNECGHSRYARLEVRLRARETRELYSLDAGWGSGRDAADARSAADGIASRPRLVSEEDVARALTALEEESATASGAREALRERGDELARELLADRFDVSDVSDAPGLSLARRVSVSGFSGDGSRLGFAETRAACASAHAHLVASETRREALRVSLAEYAGAASADAEKGSSIEEPLSLPFRGGAAAATLASEYRNDYRCAHAFVSLALPACVALVEADARARANSASLVAENRVGAVSVADRFVKRGGFAALLDGSASPARILDAAARRDARRFIAATAAAVSPDTALALSDAPCERARALLEAARARGAPALRAEARLALGEACRAATRLASAAETAFAKTRSFGAAEALASRTLRERVFDLARLAVAAGGEDDITLCECLLLPAARAARDAASEPPERRDVTARETLAALAPIGDAFPRRQPFSAPPNESDATDAAAAAVAVSASVTRLARLWRERARSRSSVPPSDARGNGDDLAAMRGAGAWAIRLALSRASASLRSEAAALLRRLAADSARARFAALGALVHAFETLEARHDRSLAFYDLLESLLAARDEARAPEDDFRRERDDSRSAFGAPRAERRTSSPGDSNGLDPVAARFLRARGFARRALERIARETASLREADVGGREAPGLEAGAALARLVNLTAAVLDASAARSGAAGTVETVDDAALGSFGSFVSFAFDDARVDAATGTGGGFEDRLPDPDPLSRDARFARALLSAFPRDAETNAARIALDASLAAASLVRARTPETSAAAASLASLVDRVAFSGGEEGLAAVVDAAVRALRRVAGPETEAASGENALGFPAAATVPAGHALAALARYALPAEPADDAPASFPLRLSKASTQEEFIRGRMTENPYDSWAIGAETMRDVKNFVCASLDMLGLCDDDNGMELLVNGRIVALDLTVREAYDGVWRARRGGAAESGGGGAREPMDVTYRLTGLDGDATEEIVSSVALADADDVDEGNAEEVFRNAHLVRRSRGLEALLACAPLISDGGARLGFRARAEEDGSRAFVETDLSPATMRRAETSALALRLLRGVARVEKNRRALLELNAISVLLGEASRLFSDADADEGRARERGVETLLLVERLLGEEAAVAAEDVGSHGSVGASAGSSAPPPPPPKPGGLTRSFSAAFDDAARRPTEDGFANRPRRVEAPRERDAPPAPRGSPRDVRDASDAGSERVRSEPSSAAFSHSAAARHTRVFLGTLAELCAAPAAEGGGRGAARRGRGSAKRRDAAASVLARVLPRLAAHDDSAAEALAAHVTRAFERLRELDDDGRFTDGVGSAEEALAGPADRTRDESPASPLARELRCCALVAEGIAADDTGARLKRRLQRRGALAAVTSYLLDAAFAGEGAAALDKHSEGWARACARPALAPALAALRGLVKAHAESSAEARDAVSDPAALSPSERASRRGDVSRRRLLPLLHALESVTCGGVGTLAENALEAAAAADASGATRTELDALRAATRRENARRAAAQRERVLQSMGMARVPASPPGGVGFERPVSTDSAVSPSPPAFAALGTSPGEYIAVVASPSSMRGEETPADDDDDDDAPAPACRVCREGYASRPTELLGVYAYCVAVRARPRSGSTGSAPRSAREARREVTFSTVSHFNAIHFSCHDAARRADAALKTPKREWEGASLRNGETLANNLLPLAAGRACRVPPDALAAAADRWWERLAEIGGASAERGSGFASRAAGRFVGSRLRAALDDVAALLGRFAARENLASGARGGGRRSNARVVPALLALAAGELARERARSESGEGSERVDRREADGTDASRCPVALATARAAPEAKFALDALLSGELRGAALAEASGAAFPSALVLSLLVTPRETWLEARRDVCAAAAAHAARRDVDAAGFAAAAAGREAANADGDETRVASRRHARFEASRGEKAFAAAKPALLLVGLVDRLHATFQPSRRLSRAGGVAVGIGGGGGGGAAPEASSDETSEDAPPGASAAAATLALVSRALRRVGGAEADETFEEWLGEAEDAEDATELFDIMECLEDVLAPASGAAPASADAFVADAWAAVET